MLTILKTQDTAELAAICADAKIIDTDVTAYVAKDHGERLGYALYAVRDNVCEILAVESNGDAPLFDGLVRSVLFSETDNGVDMPAHFSKQIDQTLLKTYRFVEDDTYTLNSMADFLNNCKNCKNC